MNNEIVLYQGLPFDVSVVAGVISQNSLDAYTADFKEYVQFAREL